MPQKSTTRRPSVADRFGPGRMPLWGPFALQVVTAAISAVIAAGFGGTGLPHVLLLGAAAIIGTVLVDPRGLTLTVSSQPLLFALLTFASGYGSQVIADGSAGGGMGRRTRIITSAYPVIDFFPWMVGILVACIVVAVWRYITIRGTNHAISREERRRARERHRADYEGRRAVGARRRMTGIADDEHGETGDNATIAAGGASRSVQADDAAGAADRKARAERHAANPRRLGMRGDVRLDEYRQDEAGRMRTDRAAGPRARNREREADDRRHAAELRKETIRQQEAVRAQEVRRAAAQRRRGESRRSEAERLREEELRRRAAGRREGRLTRDAGRPAPRGQAQRGDDPRRVQDARRAPDPRRAPVPRQAGRQPARPAEGRAHRGASRDPRRMPVPGAGRPADRAPRGQGDPRDPQVTPRPRTDRPSDPRRGGAPRDDRRERRQDPRRGAPRSGGDPRRGGQLRRDLGRDGRDGRTGRGGPGSHRR